MYHKKELDKKVQEYREMKTLLEQVQNEVDAIKAEITLYMVENEKSEEITVDGKVTYKDSSRSSSDEHGETPAKQGRYPVVNY